MITHPILVACLVRHCHYAQRHNFYCFAESSYSECHYVDCRYALCCGALQNINASFLFSNACYHVGSQTVSQAVADVTCGTMGGRLASFVDASAVANLRTVLQPLIPAAEMWIGQSREPLLKGKAQYS